MHRSGTSALSRAISLLGPAQPVDLMLPQQDNPLGFWESASVVRLNDKVMADHGITWDRPMTFIVPGFDVSGSRAEAARILRDRYLDPAIEVLKAAYVAQPCIVLKDPRLCLFPELWAEALSALGYGLRYVMMFRNPLEVAISLRKRNNIGPARAQQMWLRYTLSALNFLSDQQKGEVVSFDALMHQRSEVVHPLVQDAPQRSSKAGKTAMAMVDTYLQPELRNELVSDVDLAHSPIMADLTKQVYAHLQTWRDTEPSSRTVAVKTFMQAHDDFVRFAGTLISIKPFKKLRVNTPLTQEKLPAVRRSLLLHYHLFKNAGTSIDAILKENFGQRWANVEFPPQKSSDHQTAIRDFIGAHPELEAISSHTLNLPPPEIEGLDIFPIVFIREPLKRLKSAYNFERQQQLDTAGAQLAKQTDFAGYLKARLAVPGDRSCRNFQSYRLAMAVPREFGDERARAIEALKRLPFVGLVEVLGDCLRARLPAFRSAEVWANATDQTSEAVQEQALRMELGPELFDVLSRENEIDREVFDLVSKKYEAILLN
jgi:hypothetical protein